jgi:hypothetical protein
MSIYKQSVKTCLRWLPLKETIDVAKSHNQLQKVQPNLWLQRHTKSWCCNSHHDQKLNFKILMQILCIRSISSLNKINYLLKFLLIKEGKIETWPKSNVFPHTYLAFIHDNFIILISFTFLSKLTWHGISIFYLLRS